jgi:hypothetical protein
MSSALAVNTDPSVMNRTNRLRARLRRRIVNGENDLDS